MCRVVGGGLIIFRLFFWQFLYIFPRFWWKTGDEGGLIANNVESSVL